MTAHKSLLIILSISSFIQNSLCTNVDIFDFPSIVSIRHKEDALSPFKHICSGSILNASVVLTSASCFSDESAKLTNYQIIAGSDIYDGNSGSVALIDRFVKHYAYQVNRATDDIAVIFLKTPFYIDNAKIATAELLKFTVNDGSLIESVGWNVDAQPGAHLMKNTFAVTYCDRNNRILCGATKNPCKKGPGSLMFQNMQLAAILSKNGNCSNEMESYTSVLAAMSWLEKVLNGEEIIVLQPAFL